jgi:hypothetical protein
MKCFLKVAFALCGFLLLLAAVPASATTMYGAVWINTSAGTYAGGSGMPVKFCTNSNGTGLCYQTTTFYNCYGLTCYPGWYTLTVPDGYSWYAFTWSTGTGDWGSSSSPSQGKSEGGGVFTTYFYLSGPYYSPFDIFTYPSPHAPTTIYPTNGQLDAPQSFTLKWTSGVDGYRTSYATTYDIYSHGFGGADILEVSNVGCHPDGSGYCTLAASGVKSSSDIYWHVVAKLNPNIFPANPYYTTSSAQFEFTTLTDPNALISFGTNDWAHYLTGAACGGGALLATAISMGGCESFKVIDQNGGDLYSGEAVNVQLGNLWYVVAENGGGNVVNVNRTSAAQWETFTIVKLSGAPGTRILNGDRVAFGTYYGNYVSALNGGGSSVNAYATSAGWSETFIYSVH